jgi:hypothetical protein
MLLRRGDVAQPVLHGPDVGCYNVVVLSAARSVPSLEDEKKMKAVERWCAVVVCVSIAAGCATTQQPGYYAYPQKGQTPEQISRDQIECQEWARQQTGHVSSAGETARGTGVGAAMGALAGAAIGVVGGAVTGSPGTGAAVGAATGAVGGALSGGGTAYGKSQDGFDRAYAACMSARGYVVR